jgi:hypothetical protein
MPILQGEATWPYLSIYWPLVETSYAPCLLQMLPMGGCLPRSQDGMQFCVRIWLLIRCIVVGFFLPL